MNRAVFTPNRAEAAVKMVKHTAQILSDSLQKMGTLEPGMREVTVYELIASSVSARNANVTYGGKTPLELAYGF